VASCGSRLIAQPRTIGKPVDLRALLMNRNAELTEIARGPGHSPGRGSRCRETRRVVGFRGAHVRPGLAWRLISAAATDCSVVIRSGFQEVCS
jgi:hypothetical protein